MPNLHVEHYAIYEQQALQEADEEIQRQSTGARLIDPTRPWSGQPFGHQTRSQASFARRQARQELHRQSKRQQEYHQVIVTSAEQKALAQDSVHPLLKPYAENTQWYHPFTGTGCTGLLEEDESLLEDKRAQPSTDPLPSACNSATPNRNDVLEEFKIILQQVQARGVTPCSV